VVGTQQSKEVEHLHRSSEEARKSQAPAETQPA